MKSKLSRILCLFVLILGIIPSLSAQYRIALSFDGNSYDADDIIAAPMALAIIAESGNTGKLVHCDYSNNLYRNTESKNIFGGGGNEDQATEMKASVDGAISRWNFNSNIFFEVRINAQLQSARTNFMNAAAAAFDAGEPLYYLCGGPMQAPIQMVEKIDENNSWSNSRKNSIKANIIVVSHSTWNENFGNNNTFDQNLPTWSDLITMGVKHVEIENQNNFDGDNDMNTPVNKWNWLNGLASRYQWLRSRNPFFNNKFDPSDAGMTYWVIDGAKGYNCCNGNANLRNVSVSLDRERYGSPAEIEDLFTNGNGGGGTPSDITISASNVACDAVTLNWGDTNGETGYRVRRKLSGAATFTNLTDVGADVVTYTDNSVSANTSYIYMVRPVVNGGAVAVSNQLPVNTPACGGCADSDNDGTCDVDDGCPNDPNKTAPGNCGCGEPEVPGCGVGTPTDITDLAATAAACNQVNLTWSDVDGETAYRVRRKLSSATTFTTLTDVSANSTSYTDNSVAESTTYIYQVRPVVNGTAVAVSNQPQVATPSCGSSGGGGVVFIDHNSSGQRLKANGSGGAVGVKAATSTGTNVQWDQQDAGGGYFYLVHVGSGNKLNSSDGTVVNTIAPSNTSNNVQWQWIDAGGGWYRLENRAHTKWLHVRPDGTQFELGPTTWTGSNTQWQFTSTSGARFASEAVLSFEGELSTIQVYPNPVQNILTIQGVSIDDTFMIYNSIGQKVMDFQGDKVDISRLSKGIYFIRDKSSLIGKILKD